MSTCFSVKSACKNLRRRCVWSDSAREASSEYSSGSCSSFGSACQNEISSSVAIGAGKFWGTEKMVLEEFQSRFPGSIKEAKVGFMSPYEASDKHPTYEKVCSGSSGYIEVLFITLTDPATYFEQLMRFFFQIHDPTTEFRQGKNRGFQFASWIFYADDEQYRIAKKIRQEAQILTEIGEFKSHYSDSKVVTKLTPLKEFTAAAEEHQQYLKKHPEVSCDLKVLFEFWPSCPSITSVSSTSEDSIASEEDEETRRNELIWKRYCESLRRRERYDEFRRTLVRPH